ncbi:hypothetical protein [Rhizobium lentis]|uniref:hypothetical protein n=1 Tax=Rhizobium lentis TaxID=1138194 RepID=UPI001C82D705|nr:hypothetical protein [Rhizobium lentis]MBX4955573.1 hypothetical protein [Rhizobium lentis]MBX4984882.1 hypothetical protein [Rhizobium lentis]MBX5003327.1 hypothetical protein [Rhizobium lentis]MBX5029364.1 hypothetical protein [Rhizobium lentis]MBX5035359.1 hypothetical protein [Rhizobium lentis]
MTHDNVMDTQRALAAAKAIIDGRNPSSPDYSKILVTAEHAFAVVLLACMSGDARKAAAMLNEGLIPGIEQRLAFYASKEPR